MALTPQTDIGFNDPTDIKIFILFLLDEIHYPLDYNTLIDVINASGYVGRYDFAAHFSELTERGHITVMQESEQTTYLISPLGHMVASELQGTLLDSIRERSRTAAMKLLSLRRRGATASCTVARRDDGQYTVRCLITEKDGVLLDTVLSVPTASEAEEIRQHFEAGPEEVLRGIASVLTGKLAYYMS